MFDILSEISILCKALQNSNLDLLKVEYLIWRTIKAFEMLDTDNGAYEKKFKKTIGSEIFKSMEFMDSSTFKCLPHEKLLQSIIKYL